MTTLRRVPALGRYWVARLTGPVVGAFTVLLHTLLGATGGGPQAIDPMAPDVKAAADTPPAKHKRWRRRRRPR